MSVAHSVETQPVAASSTTLTLAALLSAGFPSPDLVDAAAGLFQRIPAWDGREGPRARITVSAGAVRVGRHDPARAERTAERAAARVRRATHEEAGRLEAAWDLAEYARAITPAPLIGIDLPTRLAGLETAVQEKDGTWHVSPAAPKWHYRPAVVRAWSRRSRSRMRYTLASLDWAGFFGEGTPAMLTLTYPGDWVTVAPTAQAVKGHLDAFRKRFERKYGKPLNGVWKREFQRRGAPHYHIFMVPPADPKFREWCSAAWAEVVAHPDPEERRRHRLAGTGLDYREGVRAKDPRRLAAYFAKHGMFSAKDYQNEAPAEWLIGPAGIGRFWGVWGLQKALAVVEVEHQDADNAARIMRRWSRANGFRTQRQVWRANSRTGVLRPRKSGVWMSFMPGSNGFLIVNDGPAFASSLARALDIMRT